MKSKTTAILLCWFFGAFGGHCFYLDKTSQGVIRLIFSFTLIPAIIAVFDFFILIMMSESEFNKKYNPTYSMPDNNQQKFNADEISKLYELKEKGIISEEEFEAKKKAML